MSPCVVSPPKVGGGLWHVKSLWCSLGSARLSEVWFFLCVCVCVSCFFLPLLTESCFAFWWLETRGKGIFKNKIRLYIWSGKGNVLRIPRSKLEMNANCSCSVPLPNSVLPERCSLSLLPSEARSAWLVNHLMQMRCFFSASQWLWECVGTAAGVTVWSHASPSVCSTGVQIHSALNFLVCRRAWKALRQVACK